MIDPQIAVQLHYLTEAIGHVGWWITFAIIFSALWRGLFNQ